MANSVEVSAEQAIKAVASYSWCGQIAEQIYVGKRPVSDEKNQIELTAVWKGAERLADDPTVRCIVLEKNPYLVGFEDAVLLRIDLENGKGSRRLNYVYRNGVAPAIGKGEECLVRTVLGNITKLTVQP